MSNRQAEDVKTTRDSEQHSWSMQMAPGMFFRSCFYSSFLFQISKAPDDQMADKAGGTKMGCFKEKLARREAVAKSGDWRHPE